MVDDESRFHTRLFREVPNQLVEQPRGIVWEGGHLGLVWLPGLILGLTGIMVQAHFPVRNEPHARIGPLFGSSGCMHGLGQKGPFVCLPATKPQISMEIKLLLFGTIPASVRSPLLYNW
jgi:hypothetical protein